MEQQEKNRNRIAFATSAGIHLAILLLFIFSMAWRAPDPPLPEFGIELNFGDAPVGSGDVQPETPTANDQQADENPVEDVSEQVEESQQEVIPSDQESPVTVPKEETPREVTPAKPEEKKEEPKAAQSTEQKGDQPQSQGNDENKTGDKGDPKGKPDPNAAYTGTPGGGGGGTGMQLSMSGWAWANPPAVPELPDNENGRIVFEIECDEDGEIVGIKTIERGLSPQAEKLLLDEIRKNSLMKVGDAPTAERSKGRVIFVLKTK